MTGARGCAGRPGAPLGGRLDALLLERWERRPELPALICGTDGTVVTAGELRERVLRVAAALRRHGVGPGDRVAVYHERSVDFVVAVLGVLVAGGAHAAFDVDDPLPRTLDLLADCAPRTVLAGAALRGRLPAGMPVLTEEDTALPGTVPEGDAPASGSPGSPASPDDPAVVLYTSGSTGRPKASLISHRALVSRLTDLQSRHPLDEHDRMLHHTVCTFDMHIAEIYWPLLTGAAVVLAAPRRHRDADHLAELIRERGITAVYFVVSLLDLFLTARDPAERYDGLRHVLTGGEPLGAELVRRFHARSTATLTNLYGPSECTIHCTAWVCPREAGPDTVPIGSAALDTELWIVDAEGRPVPDGEPGELYIGGAGLALGYLGRPDLTAQRFVDSLPAAPGRRLYRSGDLVRSRPDGTLEFLGRVDRQVKIRGVRVEPGEIEHVAERCPGVRRAAVVAHGEGPNRQLAAFVVPETPTPTTTPTAAPTATLTAAPDAPLPTDLAASVRDALRARLPQAMVPTTVETLPELPLTPNGKLDRHALEERAAKTLTITSPPVRHTGAVPLEDLVADVWREALHLPPTDPLSPDADFFDLGGTSFTVLQVVERLRTLLKAPGLPLAALLLEPTLAGFTKEVHRAATPPS